MSNGSAYDATRLRHVAHRVRVLRTLIDRLAWPRERVAALRLESLKALLAHARAHSPWHRDRLRGVDIDALSLDGLATLPTMTKADLMENWDGIVTRPGMTLSAAEDHLALIGADGEPRYFDGDCHVVTSSGTSGRRGVFVYDWDGWAVYAAGGMRGEGLESCHAGLTRELGRSPRECIVAAPKPAHPTGAAFQCFASPARRAAGGIVPATLPVDEIVAELNRRRPEILTTYGALIAPLVAEAAAGRLSIPLRLITTTGERLAADVAAAAGRQWSLVVPVLNLWAAVETIGTFPCTAGAGSHLCDDLNVFELVGEDNRSTPLHEPSDKVLVTVLYNRLLPLIRYEIDDSFRLVPGSCGCGSSFPHVEVLGRAAGFTYRGVKVHPALFLVQLLEDPRVKAFQVRQTRTGADIDVVASHLDAAGAAAIADAIRNDLARIGVADPHVRISTVDAIPRSPSGKTASIVPLPADAP